MGDIALDGAVDPVALVKAERNRSPTYHPTALSADNMYVPATHLNVEHPENGFVRHRQYDIMRQYQWMLNDTGDFVTDCGTYIICIIFPYSYHRVITNHFIVVVYSNRSVVSVCLCTGHELSNEMTTLTYRYLA